MESVPVMDRENCCNFFPCRMGEKILSRKRDTPDLSSFLGFLGFWREKICFI